MKKKYFSLALAMPLLVACSSDELELNNNNSNDRFAGIPQVEATFALQEGPETRLATEWGLEVGDRVGLAWMEVPDNAAYGGTKLDATGAAWQNHPLNVVSGGYLQPQTSIYVGRYFAYAPYDYSTKNIAEIKFSLKNQKVKDNEWKSGAEGEYYKLAATAINIADRWTDVTLNGHGQPNDYWYEPTYDDAGIAKKFNIYSAAFSNQSLLELEYVKNNMTAAGVGTINGANDITYIYSGNDEIGAADIYSITVELDGAENEFTYGPTSEPNTSYTNYADHKKDFWATKTGTFVNATNGFNFAGASAIALTPKEGSTIATTKTTKKLNGNDAGQFWFNSLPNADGTLTAAAGTVKTVISSSYGVVTNNEFLKDVAYEYYNFGNNGGWQYVKVTDDPSALAPADSPKKINVGNTFINQYGDHKGKYAYKVDFSTGVMDGMHIKNDVHLQKALKYYIAAGKTEPDVTLKLDGTAGTFELSKISIALLQKINSSSLKVKLEKCGITGEACSKIVITQDGQAAIGLADKKEVPTLNNVFKDSYEVYLSENYDWTWSKDAALNDGNVTKIINEGNMVVTAKTIATVGDCDFENQGDITINSKADCQINVVNKGDITINSGAWLRAAGANKTIINAAGTAHKVACGNINNYGELSVKAAVAEAAIHNFGYIKNNASALTLVTTNERGATIGTSANFGQSFNPSSNAIGEIEMVVPTDYASVNNGDAQGFITYRWTGTTYSTPNPTYKFNYLKIAGNIVFGNSLGDNKIKFLEFDGTTLQDVKANGASSLSALRGIYVPAGSSFVLDVSNELKATEGIYVAGEVKVGGTLNVAGPTNSKYFGLTSNLGNISVWGGGTLN